METEKLRARDFILALFVIFIGIYGLAIAQDTPPKKPRIIYPAQTKLDFDGAKIEGEMRNPGEFYFQHRPEDKMDSLVKRRKNFHREMLRDVMLSK